LLAFVVENHPHRTFARFRRVLVRCLAHDDPSYSGVRASGKPGRFTPLLYDLLGLKAWHDLAPLRWSAKKLGLGASDSRP
jgi:hypothetical protein